MDTSLLLVLAVAVSAVVTFLVTRSVWARRLDEARLAAATELAAARQDNKWLQQEVERQQQSVDATHALLASAGQNLRDAFQSLAADALHANRGAFMDMAKATLDGYRQDAAAQLEARQKAVDGLVQPLADTLRKVESRLGDVERERVSAYARLSEQVAALGQSAQSLARALRTPSARGRWGEMQLRRVVELAGMLHKCDFEEQRGLATEGGRLRPDLIVRLPGDKQIVVDAKAPLDAFLDAQESHDDAVRTEKLAQHARQVRDHMDKLGSKAYWDQLPGSPDMVVMFLPGETLFSTALQQDLTLIEHGLQNRVLLASPITLIALLTTVAHAWRQEALAENAREVARLGKEFYERLATFTGHFDDVRKRLDGAVQAYNQAAGSFESRVLVSARRLRDLDVTTAAELPPAQPIASVPRVLTQAGLMGLPDEAIPKADVTE
jgi:DNA recombination protein RmuC